MRVLLMACLLMAGRATVRAQISPGPLAKAHAKLEGAANCAQCHGLRKEPVTQRCLACHKEIAWLIEHNRGLHAPARNVPHKECAQCHPDHAGADFDLIDWGKGGSGAFDHRRAGWALDGKHERARCTACHDLKFRHAPSAALSPRPTAAGWVGLDAACIGCHERDDVHRSSLGQACERCHDAADWKKPTRFDHAKSSYPLTGKHVDVACDKCHKAARLNLRSDADGRIIGRYKPLPFAECSTCHADPHKGRLNAACSTCHTTRDFKSVNEKAFDHAATRYPLAGRHVAVACERCHGLDRARKTPAFARCADCHADVHFGRGTLAGKAVDCSACHRVEGFAPSTYTVAQHAVSPFALKGKHAEVRCALCHTASDSVLRASPRQVLRRVALHPSAVSCEPCHADAHNGELTQSASRGRCTQCHDERGWSPAQYTAAQHATLKLALDGAHSPVACAKCHVPVRRVATHAPAGQKGTATVSLHLDDLCESCHVDPHVGRYVGVGTHTSPDGCRACHDSRRFIPATLTAARHATLGFALDGAHRAVPCRDCHKELGAKRLSVTLKSAGVGGVLLRFDGPRRTTCVACHADPHGDQFAARRAGAACEGCHDTATWVGASRFVHDRDSSFPLAGAHSRVPCAACHVRAVQSGGETRVQYRPLPTACEGCHADATLRKRP